MLDFLVVAVWIISWVAQFGGLFRFGVNSVGIVFLLLLLEFCYVCVV